MKLLMYGVSRETVIKEDVDKYKLCQDKKKSQMIDILQFEGIEEIIILVSDFRNEYYLYVDENIFSHGDFLRYLANQTGKTLEEIILETYSKFNEDVLRHLYEIASGYLSDPKGSFDILSSIEKSLNYATHLKTTGEVLLKLFNDAINLAYFLKLEDEIQPLNNSRISKYIYLLKDKMGTLANKNYVLAADDFELTMLAKILLIAGAQTITVANRDEKEIERQFRELKLRLNETESAKIRKADSKSLNYRLSKADAVILDLSNCDLLDEEIIEEIVSIRQTKKIQYLIDTNSDALNKINDEKLDVQVINPDIILSYSDEEKDQAMIVFDEILSAQIEKFMEYFNMFQNNTLAEINY